MPAASTNGDGAINAEAQAAIDAAYEGSYQDPPSESPPAKKGANVWFIPAAAELYAFNEPGAINDAAKALGWKLTTFDGKFSTDTYVSGIRQAIADKADGIILYLIDCAAVKSALQAADRAGIPVVAAEAYDCNQAKEGEPALFDAQATYVDPANPDVPATFPKWIEEIWGYDQGLGIIAGTDGNAKLIDVRQTDAAATLVADDGARQALKDHCPQCEITQTVEITGADYGAPLQQKVAQAFARHPEANAVIGPSDAATENIAAAVRGTGRKDEIWVQGAEGSPQIVNLVRTSNGASAGVGFSVQWELWNEADALNRLLNGEKPGPTGFPSGNSQQLYDKDHNLPPEGSRFVPPIDFHAAYRKAWGVG